MNERNGDRVQRDRESWIRRLKQVFRSLKGRPEVTVRERRGRKPEDFGWTETEEEYQRAQAEWLAGVERRRKDKGPRGSK